MIKFNATPQNVFQIRNTFNIKNQNSVPSLSASYNNDSVSFTSTKSEQYVDADVFRNLKKLSIENPVIGFKGDGMWLLPNLNHTPGRKFTLYMPNGEQLSCHKNDSNNFILFSLKNNIVSEKGVSKVIVNTDANAEATALTKTKNEQVLKFRVYLQEEPKFGETHQMGQIEKIKEVDFDNTEEVDLLTTKERDEINSILKKSLPYFF